MRVCEKLAGGDRIKNSEKGKAWTVLAMARRSWGTGLGEKAASVSQVKLGGRWRIAAAGQLENRIRNDSQLDPPDKRDDKRAPGCPCARTGRDSSSSSSSSGGSGRWGVLSKSASRFECRCRLVASGPVRAGADGQIARCMSQFAGDQPSRPDFDDVAHTTPPACCRFIEPPPSESHLRAMRCDCHVHCRAPPRLSLPNDCEAAGQWRLPRSARALSALSRPHT